MKSKNVKWHKISADAAVTELHTNAACGLSHKAARSRVRKLGANTLFDFPIPKKSSVWNSFLTDPAILMLLFTLLLALVFSFSASVLLSCIVCVCAFACTFRLTGRFTSLWRTVTLHRIPTVSVLREGKICEISARGVVLGDILLLGRGDIVPCDCRLLKTTGNLRTRLFFGDENGKRMALEQIKQADFVYPYEDQTFSPNYVNMLYGKSEVLEGEARAVAVATGDYTFMGALGQSTEAVSEASNCMCSAASVERFIRTCSAVLTALLIPLCFVGFFTSPKEYDVLQIFLPLCALCGVCARSVLSFFFQAIIADG